MRSAQCLDGALGRWPPGLPWALKQPFQVGQKVSPAAGAWAARKADILSVLPLVGSAGDLCRPSPNILGGEAHILQHSAKPIRQDPLDREKRHTAGSHGSLLDDFFNTDQQNIQKLIRIRAIR